MQLFTFFLYSYKIYQTEVNPVQYHRSKNLEPCKKVNCKHQHNILCHHLTARIISLRDLQKTVFSVLDSTATFEAPGTYGLKQTESGLVLKLHEHVFLCSLKTKTKPNKTFCTINECLTACIKCA